MTSTDVSRAGADPVAAETAPDAARLVRFRLLRRLGRSKLAMVSLVVLATLIAAAVLAPLITPYPPEKQIIADRLQGPSGSHWLGTDAIGRDILSRLIFGLRVSLLAGFQATAVSALLGIPIGLISGYTTRLVDGFVNTVAEALMAIPPLLLALSILGIRGPGLTNAMLAIGVILAPRFYKVARASARSVREETYIEASRSIGCSTPRILWRHVLPNISGPLLVQTSFVIGLAIVAEASLSFIGLGVQDPTPSLGSMVHDASRFMRQESFGIWPPSVAIVVIVSALSILGDAIRDALGRD